MSITWNTDHAMHPAAAKAEHDRQDAIRWAVRDALIATPGLTNDELYARFGPSAIKRLNDLQQHHGYTYAKEHVSGHTWRYRFTSVSPKSGEPGYLASLPVVASIDRRGVVRPTTPAPTPTDTGRLF